MFRWGIIFLVIALIANRSGLRFRWASRYGSLGCESCFRRRYYSIPYQFIYRT